MHNAPRSLRRGVSTIQPGEHTADDEVFEISLLEKHVLYHPPRAVFLLLERIYNLHACHPEHNTSSLVVMFVMLYFNTYTSILAQASVLIFKTCVACNVQCVVCSAFHTNCNVGAPEFLNCPGILRTASQTRNNVSWSCLFGGRIPPPSIHVIEDNE